MFMEPAAWALAILSSVALTLALAGLVVPATAHIQATVDIEGSIAANCTQHCEQHHGSSKCGLDCSSLIQVHPAL
jgi:hypothetical protein